MVLNSCRSIKLLIKSREKCLKYLKLDENLREYFIEDWFKVWPGQLSLLVVSYILGLVVRKYVDHAAVLSVVFWLVITCLVNGSSGHLMT